jgi:hypothetical protein
MIPKKSHPIFKIPINFREKFRGPFPSGFLNEPLAPHPQFGQEFFRL